MSDPEFMTRETPEGLKRIDNTELQFLGDDALLGEWVSVDFVRSISDFIPGNRSNAVELWIVSMHAKPNGDLQIETTEAKQRPSPFCWTNGHILNKIDETCSSYSLSVIDDETYLFWEWKSGDYQYRNQAPWFYVMKKLED